MKSMNLIFRRAHLYLGKLLIPWMFVYAFSSFMLNHGPTFRQYRPAADAYELLWEKDYETGIPQNQKELRTWAGAVLEEHGVDTVRPLVNRNSERVLITAQRFLRPIRVSYRFSDGKLRAEQREASFFESMLRLHFRHGYGEGSVMQWIWAFLVDLVCVSFIIWVVTGLYLWWKMPHTRNWGWVAIGAGFLSFIGIYIAL
tara:strand:+ start:1150 stop:1749 length:600 start_codon:yes stop_codon:yes gene_type:complete